MNLHMQIGTVASGGQLGACSVFSSQGSYILDDGILSLTGLDGQPAQESTVDFGANMVSIEGGANADVVAHDTPENPLWSKGPDWLGVNEAFVDYLMYQPATANSIPVTLETLSWNWSGVAVKGAGGRWSVVSPLVYGYLPTTDVERSAQSSTTLPEWASDWSTMKGGVPQQANQIQGYVLTPDGRPAAGAGDGVLEQRQHGNHGNHQDFGDGRL